MKYVDASAIMRVLFYEPGPSVPLRAGDRIISSRLLALETFRAVDRVRLLGALDDQTTAVKRKELAALLAMLDLVAIDQAILDRAAGSFAIPLRALDAIHVATAEEVAATAEGEDVEFWTHDQRQAIAAISRGLAVRGLGGPPGDSGQ